MIDCDMQDYKDQEHLSPSDETGLAKEALAEEFDLEEIPLERIPY